MGVNPEYTRLSRVVMGLSVALVGLIALASFFSVRYAQDDDVEDGERFGIFLGIAACGLTTISLVCCAFAVNNAYMLQCYACMAFIFTIMFLALGGSAAADGLDSKASRQFVIMSLLIGIMLFVSFVATLRLSRMDDFDTAFATERKRSNASSAKQEEQV